MDAQSRSRPPLESSPFPLRSPRFASSACCRSGWFACGQAPAANLVAASGNCSMMACTCPRNEYVPRPSAPITLAITMTVPDNARDLDRFEPCDERIQRVGKDDAEQQRHQESLRPGQGVRAPRRAAGTPQRQAPRIRRTAIAAAKCSRATRRRQRSALLHRRRRCQRCRRRPERRTGFIASRGDGVVRQAPARVKRPAVAARDHRRPIRNRMS